MVFDNNLPTKLFFSAISVALSFVLSSCAPPPVEIVKPTVVEKPVEPTVTVTPLKDESLERAIDGSLGQSRQPTPAIARIDLINAAHEWLSQAASITAPQRQDYQLKSAAALIQADQLDQALQVLNTINVKGLPALFSARKRYLRAQLAMRTGRLDDAERYLQTFRSMQTLGPEFRATVLSLRAQARLATGKKLLALRDLVEREAYLVDNKQIQLNRSRIWFILGGLNAIELQIAKQPENDPALNGWLDLALIYLDFGSDSYRLQQALMDWQQQHEADSASAFARDVLRSPAYQLSTVRQIALLLPLASKYGSAAQMVHDGFMAMHGLDSNPQKPKVMVYDIGEVPELAVSYYQLAVSAGAEIVIGPLGKDAATAIVNNAAVSVPTLLLGGTAQRLPNQAYLLDLAPELEAEKVATRAFFDGHRVSGILYPETDWGRRMYQGFVNRWESMGGIVAESRPYVDKTADYSNPIQQLLNLNNSNGRKNTLSVKLGQKLNFQPRRRQDLDMVFVAARPTSGRLIKPQINFFQAHDISVYATSHIYNGFADPANDADLDGVIFGDMPWLLQADDHIRQLRKITSNQQNTSRGPLDRLFALGMDAYTLSKILPHLGDNQISNVRGVTANLSFEPDGRINRKLTWAKFLKGVPVILEATNYGERVLEPLEMDKTSESREAIGVTTDVALGHRRTLGTSSTPLFD